MTNEILEHLYFFVFGLLLRKTIYVWVVFIFYVLYLGIVYVFPKYVERKLGLKII